MFGFKYLFSSPQTLLYMSQLPVKLIHLLSYEVCLKTSTGAMLTDVDTLFKESQWFHTCKHWHTAAIGSAALLPVSPFCSCWVIWAWSKVEDQQTDRHFCISSYASSRAYMLLLSKLINPYWFQIGLCGGMKSQVCGRPTPSFVLLWKKRNHSIHFVADGSRGLNLFCWLSHSQATSML